MYDYSTVTYSCSSFGHPHAHSCDFSADVDSNVHSYAATAQSNRYTLAYAVAHCDT
jgi:hypothetical protein